MYRPKLMMARIMALVLGLLTVVAGAAQPGEERVSLSLFDGKLVFDFIQPAIPELYRVSYEYRPDPRFFSFFEKQFFSYCRTEKGLEDLEEHRIEDESRVEYDNNTAVLVINKENGWIGFINRPLLSSTEEPVADFNKAKDFIRQYGGGFDGEVIAEWLGTGDIVFLQQVDGVKVIGDLYQGIHIRLLPGGIVSFRRHLARFTKGDVLPVSSILEPRVAIKISIPDLESMFLNLDQQVTIRECNMVYYMPSNPHKDNILKPAWEFVYHININGVKSQVYEKRLVIDACHGGVLRGGRDD